MEAAMDLMRRMPPAKSDKALANLIALLPAYSQELLSRVDQTLEEAWDEDSQKKFLLCDYNRDGDAHRSPWSSNYIPFLEDGVQPSEELRKMEIEANNVFALYRDQYYEGGISSVYMWEPENGQGFFACFLIKKDGSQSGDGQRGLLQHGIWEAIHVFEVGEEEDGIAHYCLTSTVMLGLTSKNPTSGTFSLSGAITRQMESDLEVGDGGHNPNMGKMVEEMESKLRNALDQVYFGKTKEVMYTLREPLGTLSATSVTGHSIQQNIINDMMTYR